MFELMKVCAQVRDIQSERQLWRSPLFSSSYFALSTFPRDLFIQSEENILAAMSGDNRDQGELALAQCQVGRAG